MNIFFNTFFLAFLLPLIQIIGESLPISSSGHEAIFLSIASYLSGSCVTVTEAYNYLLHGPTIIIIAFFFRQRWLFLLRRLYHVWPLILKICFIGICAEAPTIAFYLLIRRYEYITLPLWLGFGITAALLFSLIIFNNSPGVRSLTPAKACIIGITQGIALLPGISRLASTYTVGRWLGLHPRISFIFSCTIQWPLITLGFCKGLLGYLYSSSDHASYFFTAQYASREDYIWLLWILWVLGISILAYGALRLTYTLVLTERVWRLGFYMLLPMIGALLLC
jgi:undecaprenyl-diphosphatase